MEEKRRGWSAGRQWRMRLGMGSAEPAAYRILGLNTFVVFPLVSSGLDTRMEANLLFFSFKKSWIRNQRSFLSSIKLKSTHLILKHPSPPFAPNMTLQLKPTHHLLDHCVRIIQKSRKCQNNIIVPGRNWWSSGVCKRATYLSPKVWRSSESKQMQKWTVLIFQKRTSKLWMAWTKSWWRIGIPQMLIETRK